MLERPRKSYPTTTAGAIFFIRVPLRYNSTNVSEASDKVLGVTHLPVFPLPVVLFPGVPLPLHIFEPRYRQMLKDIRVANNLFCVAYFDPSTTEVEVPPAGHVGCVAEVTDAEAPGDDAVITTAHGLTLLLSTITLQAGSVAGCPRTRREAR